ncbi:hypothetical protein EIP91_002374 [Steccherinum ochraceum]|uniref:C3H1-type domain-containing protein n=1 Tax=Steccherinum ochraceum TaxID=92696 RepID=A0A4R0RTF3_9APHY|nr:hypothetical protein EIP91_002374 [Steccherinum ochraceum]
MHDNVTKSPSPTTFYTHNPSDDKSSSHTTKSSIAGSRDIMSANRRGQAAQANGGQRWRFNGTGQLVDAASSEWDLSDEIVKLQISGDGADGNAQLRTPPQPKGNVGSVLAIHESSPLETASDVSADSGSPTTLDNSLNFASHSRGSSADTTGSTNSQNLHAAPFNPLKVANLGESRNRPHSYSGGLSTADLVRLQQAGSPGVSSNGAERQGQGEPTYPSLTNGRSPDHQQQSGQQSDDPQQRKFGGAAQASQYPPNGRAVNVAPNQPYRQGPPRGFNAPVQVPGVAPNATFAYPGPMHPGPISISNSQQQLYDMMLPTPPLDNPTMARLQQGYRPGHQHSASDPASLRDPATLALINSSMQAFAAGQMYPGMAPPAMAMFANQFYGAPQEYPAAELAMMARLQAQYSGPYGLPVPPQGVPLAASNTGSTVGGTPTGNGPSANNRKLGLYKTELCRSWEEKGTCRYGTKCQFAHGEDELRKVQRHPKYKTEICRTFWVSGSCPYGKRCCFIHTELPASGGPPGADGTPPPPVTDGRPRSATTGSDNNDVPTSLLARISAKRTQEGSGSSTTSTTPPSAGMAGRPIPLRVDTSVIDPANSAKQNKSAYPTFAHNGILMQAGEEAPARSPGPVTAAPDFGRHANARMNIVGTQQQMSKTPTSNNPRHSYSGSEDFSNGSTPTASTNQASQQQQQYGMSSPEQPRPSRINGHVRAGSAGNWGAATNNRASHLTAYPLSSIPGGELKTNSPWADYGVNNNRVVEKTWV